MGLRLVFFFLAPITLSFHLPDSWQKTFRGRLRVHATDISRLQRFLDPLGAVFLFQLFFGRELWFRSSLGLHSTLWLLVATILLLPTTGIYASSRHLSLLTLFRRVTRGWTLVISFLLSLSFVTQVTAYFTRTDSIIWASSFCMLLLLNHVILRMLLRRHRATGGNYRTLLYWGSADSASELANNLQQAPWMGLQIIAWFCPAPISSDCQPAHLPTCGGDFTDMRRWLACNSVDRIIFSHLEYGSISIEQLLQVFGDTSLPVVYAPHWARAHMRFTTNLIGNQPCVELWGAERSLTDRNIKRILDLLLSTFGLFLLSPFLLLISVAIAATSPGPIFFVQDRYGLDCRRFRIFKFRTMHVSEGGDSQGLLQAIRNDPRLTPIGAFLRRWSLDELPQLINVLFGHMSLVGPRPHAVEHNEYYRRLIPGYMQRHAFKPGITGLAQVEGFRGETRTLDLMERRVEADLRYQRDWSLKLDIKILIKTLLYLRSPKAY